MDAPLDIEIVIEDNTLPLSELEGFIAEYTTLTARQVKLINRWGGVAAADLWIEIAVAIMARDLLRLVGSDVYELVKRHLVSLYHKIRPSGARTYIEGRMALVMGSSDGAVTLHFCFPSELTDSEVLSRWRSVEESWEGLTTEWSERVRERYGEDVRDFRIELCFDVEAGEWRECEEDKWIWSRNPDPWD